MQLLGQIILVMFALAGAVLVFGLSGLCLASESFSIDGSESWKIAVSVFVGVAIVIGAAVVAFR